ncbi:MAG: ATP-binding cassette domain-containing protein, partial [Acidobacteria bacterium]|nr:ATP-binding cassette domain-containing protein [Acidobacteriota bacterium]
MLIVEHVSKSYPTPSGPLAILEDVSMTLERGHAAAIMGPSGSGKSTLLYVLGALEPPSSGRVTLDGADPWTMSEAEQAAFRNQRVGFVFQDHLLLPQLTAVENVVAPAMASAGGVTPAV